MRISVTLTLLFAFFFAAVAQASPSETSDDLNEFLLNKGVSARLDQVRQSVGLKASELVFTAMGFLGVPYRRGGNTAESGFDCSGFVRATYQQTVGLILPRRSEQQAAATQTIERTDLQPGDLVFFNTMRRAFSHVGIYIGEGKFIHSPKPGSKVRVENMGLAYWTHRFDGARRVQTALPQTPEFEALLLAEPTLR
jgi:cell wall-associated NlpC family hydrolase